MSFRLVKLVIWGIGILLVYSSFLAVNYYYRNSYLKSRKIPALNTFSLNKLIDNLKNTALFSSEGNTEIQSQIYIKTQKHYLVQKGEKVPEWIKDSVVDTMFSDEKDKQREYIKKKLFSDLGDNYNFDFSMRNFYTNPNTTIPNDQGGFANFCFGDMVSAKEGNEFALGRWQPRIGGTYN